MFPFTPPQRFRMFSSVDESRDPPSQEESFPDSAPGTPLHDPHGVFQPRPVYRPPKFDDQVSKRRKEVIFNCVVGGMASIAGAGLRSIRHSPFFLLAPSISCFVLCFLCCCFCFTFSVLV